jgi:hypothetical protein
VDADSKVSDVVLGWSPICHNDIGNHDHRHSEFLEYDTSEMNFSTKQNAKRIEAIQVSSSTFSPSIYDITIKPNGFKKHASNYLLLIKFIAIFYANIYHHVCCNVSGCMEKRIEIIN